MRNVKKEFTEKYPPRGNSTEYPKAIQKKNNDENNFFMFGFLLKNIKENKI